MNKQQPLLQINNLSLAYGVKEILKAVQLTVCPGEILGIVGSSGGGKSTLCQLVPRFYDPDSGTVSVDGHDVRCLTQRSLRRSIGIVQQDVFLFADTIRENIRYGKPGATMEEIVEAAKRAEIYDDIMAMPDGFDTYVGERGTLLSGGQKQRLSIARAIARDPMIYIFDDSFSALDFKTDAALRKALAPKVKDKTVLIVAQRISTVMHAEQIIVLDDGKVAGIGTHKELMENCEIYRQIAGSQLSESELKKSLEVK